MVMVFIPAKSGKKFRRSCPYLIQWHSFACSFIHLANQSIRESFNECVLIASKGPATALQARTNLVSVHMLQMASCFLPVFFVQDHFKKSNYHYVLEYFLFVRKWTCLVPFNQQL